VRYHRNYHKYRLRYAGYSDFKPDILKIVGVAEPRADRRQEVARKFDIPPDHCFETAEEMSLAPKFADVVINGTMDAQHVPTSLPVLEAGYDLLLEKPFATTVDEMWQLVDATKANSSKVVICHVLRFLNAHVKMLPRPGPDHLDEERRRPDAGGELRRQHAVSAPKRPRKRWHKMSFGLPGGRELFVLRQETVHRPPRTLAVLCLGRV